MAAPSIVASVKSIFLNLTNLFEGMLPVRALLSSEARYIDHEPG